MKKHNFIYIGIPKNIVKKIYIKIYTILIVLLF